MLKELRLSNIVLVESAIIEFTAGFNVISGESGSGKSAVMNALNLIAGHRSDISILRRGESKGYVEAVFSIETLPSITRILEESGIDHDSGHDLFIRRELTSQGKSRAFINNQLAQLAVLRDVTDQLFHIVGQHANQKLLSLEFHRHILDTYGDLSSLTTAFAKSWEEENSLKAKLEAILQSEAQRFRDMDIYRHQVEELTDAKLVEGEEEELFASYTRLSNAEELASYVQEISKALTGDKQGALISLSRHKNTLEKLAHLDPSLESLSTSYQQALIELEEINYTLTNYGSRIEHNPEETERLNTRLETINKLKKKYGTSIADIQTYLKSIEEKLHSLENADVEIEELQEKLKAVSTKNNTLARDLTKKRLSVAKKLEQKLASELHALNMPKATCAISIIPQKRTRSGDDLVEIFITPNVGEHQVSLRECASGGELSRFMLALQTIIAGKEETPTIIFDEIDANIGGTTATIVGEKLQTIGKKHQVISITHFPQVAKQADNHIRISKEETSGRTLTLVENLDEGSREHELARMHGET